MLLGFGQIGRALAGIMAKGMQRRSGNGAGKLRLVAAIDTSGFVFEPGGLTARAVGELSDRQAGGTRPGGGARADAAPSPPTP